VASIRACSTELSTDDSPFGCTLLTSLAHLSAPLRSQDLVLLRSMVILQSY
jgi:hypothetical protein